MTDPRARPPAAPMTEAEAEAEAEVMALFARVGRCTLASDRESWTELVQVGEDVYLRHGAHLSANVSTTRIPRAAAWARLRSLGLERLWRARGADAPAPRPEEIAGWFRAIWAGEGGNG